MFREGPSPLSAEPLLIGIRLSFTRIAGRSYGSQHAPVVTGPWNTINTQINKTTDVASFGLDLLPSMTYDSFLGT